MAKRKNDDYLMDLDGAQVVSDIVMRRRAATGNVYCQVLVGTGEFDNKIAMWSRSWRLDVSVYIYYRRHILTPPCYDLGAAVQVESGEVGGGKRQWRWAVYSDHTLASSENDIFSNPT